MSVLIETKNLILDAVFPKQCLCGRWGEILCPGCYKSIPINKTQLCPYCRKISENGKVCTNCRAKSNLTGVMIFGDHEGVLKDTIWQYKYNFIRDLKYPLANLLSEKFGDFIKKKQFLITFVPVSQNRLHWRGFNQSELLAKELAGNLDLNYTDLLAKKGRIKPQVGLMRKERIKNLSGKIVLKSGFSVEELKNKRALIVDDVYTTGTTLEECAKVLRQNRAREVWGVVLSRD